MDEVKPVTTQGWVGSTPVFLVIRGMGESGNVGIDLDEPGWTTTYAGYMRKPGLWELWTKDGVVRLRMMVYEGDQPYYVARHVGRASSASSSEIVVYGIGKKIPKRKTDGQNRVRITGWEYMRLWLLPDWSVCGGDDESPIGIGFISGPPIE